MVVWVQSVTPCGLLEVPAPPATGTPSLNFSDATQNYNMVYLFMGIF